MKLLRSVGRLNLVLVWSLAGLTLLFISYLFLQSGIFPLPYIKVSTLHELILLSFELFLVSLLFRISTRNPWGITQKSTYLLVFLIVNGFAAYPFVYFYLDPSRQEIPAILTLQPYLIPGYLALWSAAGIAALMAYQDTRRFRSWLVSRLYEQKKRDDVTGLERAARFAGHYPKIARLPVLGFITQKIYRQGMGYVLALILLTAVGLALRLWNIQVLPPYADELFHLNAAKAILQGASLQEVGYRRSFYTVTLPVVISFKVFGIRLWAARLAGVLFNVMGVIPLYWLGKRINKPVATLAAGLYLFSPWIIATSRTVREYAYYPFYFYLVAWVMMKFYEKLPSGMVFSRDYKKLLSVEILVYAGSLGLVLLYVIQIDPLSTFRVIFGMVLAFGLLVLRKFDLRHPANLIALGLTGLVGTILSISFFNSNDHSIATGGINDYYLKLFFESPPQQWYFNRPWIPIVLIVLVVWIATALHKSKPELFFILLTYTISHLSFALLWVKGSKPRYGISIEFWHILLMAAGLFIAQVILHRLVRVRGVVWVVLILLFWNIPQSLVPSLHRSPGEAPVTNEYHADLLPAYTYLQKHIRPGDGVVSSLYFSEYIAWMDHLALENVYPINQNRAKAKAVVSEAVSKHPHGWLVLYPRGEEDWWQPLPAKDHTYEGIRIKFIGWYGDQYILRWGD